MVIFPDVPLLVRQPGQKYQEITALFREQVSGIAAGELMELHRPTVPVGQKLGRSIYADSGGSSEPREVGHHSEAQARHESKPDGGSSSSSVPSSVASGGW